MSRWNVFRDDDVNCFTDVGLLREVHEMIVSHGKIHTVAVEVENVWRAKDVWFFLQTEKNLNVVLHGWDHSDYSKMPRLEICQHVRRSLEEWNHHSLAYDTPHPLTVWCPPWNRVSHDMEVAANAHGLKIDIRWKGDSDVYGFHYWECRDPERKAKLIKALNT